MLRRHVAVLALYAGLALLLTWPLPVHFATHVTGDGIDDPALAWNLWWVNFRLIDQLDLDLFHSNWIFYPTGINLAFYTLTPLNGLLAAPLQTALGLVVANNILLLATFVIGGYGAYLLCASLLVDEIRARGHSLAQAGPPLYAAAAMGGLIYAFASSKLFYSSLGQFNIASSHWIPFYVLYLWRTVGRDPRPRARNGLLIASLFFTLQAWSELTFASFLLIFTAMLFLVRILLPTSPRAEPFLARTIALLRQGLILALPIAIGLAPILWAMAPDLRAEGDFFARGGGFADIFSADLMGFFVPTRLHPLFGPWVARLPFPNDKGQHIYMGYTLLLLAGITLFRTKLWRSHSFPRTFFALSTLLFWLLALGPKLRFAGQALAVPGPFALVSLIPFFNGNRYPSRYSVMIMLGLAVLASMGLFGLSSRNAPAPTNKLHSYTRVLPALLLSLLFLFEHLSVPLPITDLRVPSIYRQIADLPGDGAILELPTGWRNGARVLGRSDELIMMQQWYQTLHNRPRLGGNTSRNPEQTFQYFTEAPLLGALIAVMNGDRPHIESELLARWPQFTQESRDLAPQVLQFLNVEYVTLHVNRAPARLLQFVEQVLPLELVDAQTSLDWQGMPAEIRLYRVQRPPPQPQPATTTEISLSSALSNLNLAGGWSAYSQQDALYRYATRRRPVLLLDLSDASSIIEVYMHPNSQLDALIVNGARMPVTRRFTRDQTIARVEAPRGVLSQTIDRLEFQFAQPALPAMAYAPSLQSDDASLVGRFQGSIFVRSAGEEVGDFAHIYVNGIDYADGERGYNLVAIDAHGAIVGRRTFDTFASPSAADEMAHWIEGWEKGVIIVGAVADSASDANGDYLSQRAIDALRAIGVADDMRGKFRWSHAFVGVVGAQPGAARQSTALFEPASVFVGAPLDSEEIAGAVERITVTYR